MVFLKRPYVVRGTVDYNSTNSHALKAHVDFNLTAGHSDNSVELYEARETADTMCPKEILLFHPPPAIKSCDPGSFSNISMLTKYTVDLQLADVSFVFKFCDF